MGLQRVLVFWICFFTGVAGACLRRASLEDKLDRELETVVLKTDPYGKYRVLLGLLSNKKANILAHSSDERPDLTKILLYKGLTSTDVDVVSAVSVHFKTNIERYWESDKERIALQIILQLDHVDLFQFLMTQAYIERDMVAQCNVIFTQCARGAILARYSHLKIVVPESRLPAHLVRRSSRRGYESF